MKKVSRRKKASRQPKKPRTPKPKDPLRYLTADDRRAIYHARRDGDDIQAIADDWLITSDQVSQILTEPIR